MLKALLKKLFLELNAYYFQNRKTGKNRSKGGVVLMILLFVFLYAVMGSLFFSMAAVMADPLIAAGLDWVYFAIMGMMGLALGVFGSVFNTYSGLYRAKDNELLLSMPIPPRRILLIRMLGVYAMGLLFEAIVMIPTEDQSMKYYMSRTKTGMDNMALHADGQLYGATEKLEGIDYNKYLTEKMQTNAPQAALRQKADAMIKQIEDSLEKLASDIRRIDKSYTSYKARNYLSFRDSYQRFTDRIEPVNSVFGAVLLLGIAFTVTFFRQYFRRSDKKV